ncbi:hypothetical protein [Mesorhizobium sp. f-mel]
MADYSVRDMTVHQVIKPSLANFLFHLGCDRQLRGTCGALVVAPQALAEPGLRFDLQWRQRSEQALIFPSRNAGCALRARRPQKHAERQLDEPHPATVADRRPLLFSFLGLAAEIPQQDCGYVINIEDDPLCAMPANLNDDWPRKSRMASRQAADTFLLGS